MSDDDVTSSKGDAPEPRRLHASQHSPYGATFPSRKAREAEVATTKAVRGTKAARAADSASSTATKRSTAKGEADASSSKTTTQPRKRS